MEKRPVIETRSLSIGYTGRGGRHSRGRDGERI